jgi:hypothetical protein
MMSAFLSRLADDGDERRIGHERAEESGAAHTAALGVVVRIDGYDPRDARVTSRGNDERDRAAD